MIEPYYQRDGVTLYCGDARDVLPQVYQPGALAVSDPPYNIGLRYDGYSDRLSRLDYRRLLVATIQPPCVVIHYPERMFEVADVFGVDPTKCVAWVYNANTPRQWRMISWFGVEPDLSLCSQPYKNPDDRRVRRLMQNGSPGAALYDWWEEQQVKNVEAEKVDHPCQIPVAVMMKILAVSPPGLVIDLFAGSGSTLLAARALGRQAIGIELSEKYCSQIRARLDDGCLYSYANTVRHTQLPLFCARQ
jgi:DNA modification methylase